MSSAFPAGVAITSGNRPYMTPESMRGLTKREYFAAHVTEYEIRSALESMGFTGELAGCKSMGERLARARLHVADEMIKALDQ